MNIKPPYSSHSYLSNDVVNNIDNNIIRCTNTNRLEERAYVEHGMACKKELRIHALTPQDNRSIV
jgi:hypothetical protein